MAILNCSLCMGRWILRGRLLSLKVVHNLPEGTEPKLQLSAAASADHEVACENAAILVRLISALPKDRPNFYW